MRTRATLPLSLLSVIGVSIGCAMALGSLPPPEQALAKNETVLRFQCTTCHTIAGNGGTVGPALDRIGNRRSSEWLRRWLTDPSSVKPGTPMPNFQLGESDIDGLVRDLIATKRDIPTREILAEANSPAEAGESLMNEYGCFACHRVGAMGRDNGPDLTWIGVWQDMEWEKQWLRNPDHWRSGTFMPDFNLADDEIDAIVAFLGTLKGQRDEGRPLWQLQEFRDKPIKRGQLIFDKLGCAGCHGERGRTGGFRNPNAAPDQQVPSLLATGSKYTKAEIETLILDGSTPRKLDAGLQAPPLRSPAWQGKISQSDLDDLVGYVKSLSPD